MKTLIKPIFFSIICSLFAQCVFADECVALKVNKTEGNPLSLGEYVLKQHVFADTKIDLVIQQKQSTLPAEIRRVTFGHGDATNSDTTKNCYFQPLAIVQGGEGNQYWGWHILWAEPQALFYGRVDGEAWVSSLPKRLTKLASINPQFKLDDQTILVTWQQVENGVTTNMQALSSDEGRSWEISTK